MEHIYTLGPHNLANLNNEYVAILAKENSGWCVATKSDYSAIRDYFRYHKGDEDKLPLLKSLFNLGLVKKDNAYNEACKRTRSIYPESILLKMTAKCNYSCKYCYDFDPKRFANELPVDRIIDIIEQIIAKTGRLNITFHGGEPLLRFEDIRKVVSYLEKKHNGSSPFKYAIQTNGSLINEEIVEFFENHKFSVGISLDGLSNITDQLRSPKDRMAGTATQNFLTLLEKFGDFIRNRCGILAVLCQSNFKHLPEFVLRLQKEGIAAISTTVLDSAGRGTTLQAEKISPQHTVQLYKTWLQMIKTGEIHKIALTNLIAYMDNLHTVNPPNFCQKGPCGASDEFIVLDSDGTLRCCDCIIDDYFVLGDSASQINDIIHSPIRKQFVERREWLAKNSECSSCSWFQLCGGTCAAKAICFYQDPLRIYPVECALNKFIYKEILKEYAENPEGKLFDYYNRFKKITKKE